MHHCTARATQHLLRAAPRSTTQVRSVYLTFGMMEEAMQHLESNPFFDKYASKIEKIKERQPSALVAAVSSRKEQTRSEASDPMAAAAGVRKVSSKAAEKAKAPLPRGAYAFAPQKKLDSIMKVELLQDKSAEEISYLWTQYWQKQPVISGVMKADLYDTIYNCAAQFDKFLFPLPREQGYEFILAQFAAHEIHFTPLINYQAYQENAPECLTMVHFPELKEQLGIVLMRGEYDSKLISGKEAQFLANQVQLYYSGRDSAKTALLRTFHDNPEKFSHMDLVKQLEQLDLSALDSIKTKQ